ncbi:glycine zipper 2TM domain-containing protein [Candidatus Peregrinibacteria bacterium]|nr:glycine zipper 2TM domain-containing protein [Candidatus Peregrinibacteria bacterium]
MKKVAVWMLMGIFFTASCAKYPAQSKGAVMGGAVGAAAGALLNKKNRWKGAVIGAVAGAVIGATIADIVVTSSKEAAKSGKSVSYKSEDGRDEVLAEPIDYDPKSKKTLVRQRVWEDGELKIDETKKIKKD